MNRQITKVVSAIIISLTCLSFAIAGDISSRALPGYYPDSMPWRGNLQAVNITANRLTINATDYAFDPNVKVHSLNTEHSSIHMLKPGIKVGFQFYSTAERRVISKIWILPSDVEVAL